MDLPNNIEQFTAKFALLKEGKMSEEEEMAFRSEAKPFPELHHAIQQWEELNEIIALSASKPAPAKMKGTLMDELLREEWREQTSTHFPVLNSKTKPSDLASFVKKEKIKMDLGSRNFMVQPLVKENGVETMLVHVKTGLPSEVHTNVIEQFLVLQGECKVQMGEETVIFKTGDYLRIPMFVHHSIEVTSEEPCVFICQRISA